MTAHATGKFLGPMGKRRKGAPTKPKTNLAKLEETFWAVRGLQSKSNAWAPTQTKSKKVLCKVSSADAGKWTQASMKMMLAMPKQTPDRSVAQASHKQGKAVQDPAGFWRTCREQAANTKAKPCRSVTCRVFLLTPPSRGTGEAKRLKAPVSGHGCGKLPGRALNSP